MGNFSNDKNHNDTITRIEKPRAAVVMVPLAAQGHLNQLLQLSCLISSYGIPVHYVGSAIHNRQAMARANGLNPQDLAKIQFHDIPIPPFETPSPDPNSPNKYPVQFQPAWYASLSLREPVAAMLQDLANKFDRVAVIHDPMMAVVVQDVASIDNAESYAFNCISAFSQAWLIGEKLGKKLLIEPPKELPSFEECVPTEVHDFVALQTAPLSYRAGNIYNTEEGKGVICNRSTGDSARWRFSTGVGLFCCPYQQIDLFALIKFFVSGSTENDSPGSKIRLQNLLLSSSLLFLSQRQ